MVYKLFDKKMVSGVNINEVLAQGVLKSMIKN